MKKSRRVSNGSEPESPLAGVNQELAGITALAHRSTAQQAQRSTAQCANIAKAAQLLHLT